MPNRSKEESDKVTLDDLVRNKISESIIEELEKIEISLEQIRPKFQLTLQERHLYLDIHLKIPVVKTLKLLGSILFVIITIIGVLANGLTLGLFG